MESNKKICDISNSKSFSVLFCLDYCQIWRRFQTFLLDFSQICRRREGWSVPLRLDILNKFYTKSPILDPSNIDKNKQEITSAFPIIPTKTYRKYFLDFQQIDQRKMQNFLLTRSHLVDVEIHHHWLFPAPRLSERGQGVRKGRDKKVKMKVWKVWKWKPCHHWGSPKVGSWTERLTKWKWKFDVWRLYFALGYFSFDVKRTVHLPHFPPCLAVQLNL